MKNKAAQALAKLRHLSLTPKERSKIASNAAKARWKRVIHTPTTDELAKK